MLNIFEVILRNAINEHYKAYFNDSDWICSQLAPGGMLAQHPQKLVVDKTIADLTAAGRYTNDRVVSSVTFGFWTYLFTKKPFRLGGQSLLRIFPAKATGLGSGTHRQIIKNRLHQHLRLREEQPGLLFLINLSHPLGVDSDTGLNLTRQQGAPNIGPPVPLKWKICKIKFNRLYRI